MRGKQKILIQIHKSEKRLEELDRFHERNKVIKQERREQTMKEDLKFKNVLNPFYKNKWKPQSPSEDISYLLIRGCIQNEIRLLKRLLNDA